MESFLNDGEIHLTENSPIRLRKVAGQRITCTAGTVWITVAGNTGDIFLASGETYRVQCNGLALVEAIGAGSFRIDRHDKFPALRMWIRNLRGIFHPDQSPASQPSEPTGRESAYSGTCAASRSCPSFRSW